MAASLDGVLIKKANKQETYTNEQVEDLLKCKDPDEGYLHFARHFAFIQHPVKGKLLFDPYEYQLRLMHSYHSYRFNINMMPRQTGRLLVQLSILPGTECLIQIKLFLLLLTNTQVHRKLWHVYVMC